MRLIRVPILALCAVLLAFQPASARPSVTEDYIGTFDPLTFGVCANSQVPVNIGVVCFDVNSAVDNYVDISGVDLAFQRPGMFYLMLDESGGCVGDPGGIDPCPNAGFVCGSANNVAVPNGTVSMEVYALGTLGVVDCTAFGTGATTGASSAGTITAHFTQNP